MGRSLRTDRPSLIQESWQAVEDLLSPLHPPAGNPGNGKVAMKAIRAGIRDAAAGLPGANRGQEATDMPPHARIFHFECIPRSVLEEFFRKTQAATLLNPWRLF